MRDDDDYVVKPSLPQGHPLHRRIVTAFAAAASLALPAAALATTTATRTGSFDAMGTGTLAAQGNLRVFGTVEGTVLIRDRVGGAIVKIAGFRQKAKRTIVNGKTVRIYTLKRVNATFYAKGRNIRVELRSPKETLSISAVGRGTVLRMAGEGTYHLNGGVEELWSSALLPLAIAPPPPVESTPLVVPGGPTAGVRV